MHASNITITPQVSCLLIDRIHMLCNFDTNDLNLILILVRAIKKSTIVSSLTQHSRIFLSRAYDVFEMGKKLIFLPEKH